MVTGGDTATVTIVMRMRDEATRQLQRTGDVLARNAEQFLRVGAVASVFGGGLLAVATAAAKAADTAGTLDARTAALKSELSELGQTIGRGVLPVMTTFLDIATNVLAIMNKLPDPVLRVGGAFLVFSGGLLAVSGAIALLVGAIAQVIVPLQSLFTAQAFLEALKGPRGVANVLGAIAVGAAAGLAVSQLVGQFQTGGVVPGPTGAPQLAIVHGGEEVLTEEQRRTRGGNVFNFHAPVFMDDESGMRRLARELDRLQRVEGLRRG